MTPDFSIALTAEQAIKMHGELIKIDETMLMPEDSALGFLYEALAANLFAFHRAADLRANQCTTQ